MADLSNAPIEHPITSEKLNQQWTGWFAAMSAYIRPRVSTVAQLPAATPSNIGERRFVSDASSQTFAIVAVGGGSYGVPVWSDGSAWRVG